MLDKNKECGKKMSFFAKYHSVLVVDKFSQKFKNCDIDLKHIYVGLFTFILLVVMKQIYRLSVFRKSVSIENKLSCRHFHTLTKCLS